MGSGIEISPGQLDDLVNKNQVEFILDLRNEDEFNAWKIEGPLRDAGKSVLKDQPLFCRHYFSPDNR